ncbi:sensor domain-containing diguanylate cyclase [Arcobacter sp. YIC-464]|uniref:sensor domain-containing diguanylate cyclase n=1 Tax=Arcobacter sp. YIC-464 TaxID=3376631 RepID=UPI003C1F8EF0
MKNDLKIVIVVSSLLVILSVSMSVVNFMVSLDSTQKDLKEYSLPLSVDNIYSEIQTHIIKPNLVSSMMAHDTFVKDWLLNEEENNIKIKRYLQMVKNKYNMFVAFLVSEKTKNYYTQDGFLETLDKNNSDNKWYFRFKKTQTDQEINLDYNQDLDNSLIMFINHKMFDEEYQLIGITGIGLKISYVDEMLKHFRQNYNFTVYFVDEDGKVVLSERKVNNIKNLNDIKELSNLKEQIISKKTKVIEYSKDSMNYLLKTKYVPELDLYLIVEAKIDDFMKTEYNTFYINLLISLFVTVIITFVIIYSIKGFNRRLEHFANNDSLTNLLNRRSFNSNLKTFDKLSKRTGNPISLLFLDIDDFKLINDNLGHKIGDDVLKRVSSILRENLRETDIKSRWGGEEFIIGLINTEQKEAFEIAQKIKEKLQNDLTLINLANRPITASFGVTQIQKEEKLDLAIVRVDNAMYEAKKSGKNKVVVK